MTESVRNYLPAAGRDIFLPLYDPIVKLLGGAAAREALLAQAGIGPTDRVFDLGCGTGTMAVLIKKRFPRVEIIGLDPDPRALTRARKKAAREALAIQFDEGFGDQLPYPAASFDRALSSFMFHHLPAQEKGKTLREVHRVLKPGGEFHMADFEGPEDRKQGFFRRLLLSHAHLKDNSAANVITLMNDAGFTDAAKVGRRSMLFGAVAYYRAVK
ncbi:MAG TPA: class I SAM-dependent methyltransferase [Terriglobales bacterium]|jgi:ubiquinone/menaquinone biosynthesis C-methylase UbiE|nr:class I SAM-dependent methyltransferase [Terriglobales bacterium]